MPVDSLVGSVGGLVLPLNPADITTTGLTPLDPARSKLIALFRTAIVYELGAAWALVTAGLPDTHALAGTEPVEDTLELEPLPNVMQQRKSAFPLLCLHRVGPRTWQQHTIENRRREQQWNLHYIMPALDVADLRRFGDAGLLVETVIERVIRQRGHKAYESGALQFFADTSGLGSVDIVSSEGPGHSRFGGGDDSPVYYATTMTLATTEYSNDDAEEFGEFEGVDYSLGVGNATEIMPDLIQAWSDVPLDG